MLYLNLLIILLTKDSILNLLLEQKEFSEKRESILDCKKPLKK